MTGVQTCALPISYTVKSIERLLGMLEFNHIRVETFIQLPSTWDHKLIHLVSNIIRKAGGPVNKVYKNKFIRFSRELMVLGSGTK